MKLPTINLIYPLNNFSQSNYLTFHGNICFMQGMQLKLSVKKMKELSENLPSCEQNLVCVSQNFT